MNILIVGCGRVGSSLALQLSESGHDVAVLEKSKARLDELTNFDGLVFCGVPIDNDVLKEAGIASCDVVCTVTDDENTNIMVSEIAKDIYHVPVVLTRVFNNDKAEIFESFGLHTICSTKLTVDAITAVLDEYEDVQFLHYGEKQLKFYTFDIPKDYIGLKAYDVVYDEGELLYGIIHADGSVKLANNNNIVFAEGDRLLLTRVVI